MHAIVCLRESSILSLRESDGRHTRLEAVAAAPRSPASPHLTIFSCSAFLLAPAGGMDGMLALHGIFTLVTRHGLEYPRFYARLYGLLTPQAFQVSV